jgi:hypothetical protein
MSSIIRTAWSVTFLAERALATTGDFLTHLLTDDLETPSSFAVFRVDFNCMYAWMHMVWASLVYMVSSTTAEENYFSLFVLLVYAGGCPRISRACCKG